MRHVATKRNLQKAFSEAYQWCSQNRKKHPPSSDIWDFRRSWKDRADAVIDAFARGEYQFKVQKRMTLSNGEAIAVWSRWDALVLKVLTWIVQEKLKSVLLKSCYHLKGNGGLKGAVRDVMVQYRNHRFFCKTDVRSYYASIDHYTLLIKLHDFIHDSKIIGYVWQFLNRCVEWGGLYQDISRGIPRGSSLSPLLGAFYLMELDKKMKKLDVKYFRYMDDILILATTRWKLKKAIRVLNQTFDELKLEKHPDKTSIGRIEKGFDFLGYHFNPDGIGIATETVERFMKKAYRLYEQEPGENEHSPRLGMYVKRWLLWTRSGFCT